MHEYIPQQYLLAGTVGPCSSHNRLAIVHQFPLHKDWGRMAVENLVNSFVGLSNSLSKNLTSSVSNELVDSGLRCAAACAVNGSNQKDLEPVVPFDCLPDLAARTTFVHNHS